MKKAGSFQEALAKIREFGDKLAGAIIDLGLPDEPGDGLVAHVRALDPDLPIILATGYARDDIHQRFVRDPSLHIVSKPFDPEALLATFTKLRA